MKKNKKILLSSICVGLVALTATPIASSLLTTNNTEKTNQVIENKETQDWLVGGGNSLPITSLRVEGKVTKSDSNSVSIQSRYYWDVPVYYIEETFWEISWNNKTWTKASWLTEEQHKLEDFTFDRKVEGNYYVRKVIKWQHQQWWDPVYRTTEPVFVSRKLLLQGKTVGDTYTESYIQYDFTFGVSSKNDSVKVTLVETSSDFKNDYGVVEKIDWTNIEKIAKKTSEENNYLWTKKIDKKLTNRYYKLILESITSEGIQQRQELTFNVIPANYQPVVMRVVKAEDREDSTRFNFDFSLRKGDLMAYRIVNIVGNSEIVQEKRDFDKIENIGTKTDWGYSFSRSYRKLYSVGKLNYRIYIEVIRQGDINIAKSLYGFSVEPRVNPNNKVITSSILTNTSKMGLFFELNGGFSRENISKLSNLSPFKKLLTFNNFLIYSKTYEQYLAEFKDINLYLSRDNGSTITVGIIYYLNNGYVFENYNSNVRQVFYEVPKNPY